MAIEQAVYTAHAKAPGGRVGTARSDDGQIDLKLDRPIEMGGKGNGTNPEQLFAAGYAACFIGALRVIAGKRHIRVPEDVAIDSGILWSFSGRCRRIRHCRGHDDSSTRNW
jgi:Ohr subfamily peroxiredoxin